MALISSCQHVMYAFTYPSVHVSNRSIPTPRDAGQHQGTTDLEGDEVSAVQFTVPWRLTPAVETI